MGEQHSLTKYIIGLCLVLIFLWDAFQAFTGITASVESILIITIIFALKASGDVLYLYV